MSWRYRVGLWLALILQVGLLGWMIADRALLLRNGTELRLAVVPVDPRDLFRGDYVVLNYAISRVVSDKVAGDDAFAYGDPVYVTIEKRDEGWQAVALGHARPAEGTVLKGRIAAVRAGCGADDTCKTYDIDYGIEKFFVPEGVGRDLEKARNAQRMDVDVALAGDGRVALKRLIVDGEPRFEEPLY